MGTKKSVFQPDHTGKRATVPVHPGMSVNHSSHPIGADTPARHGDKPNIARDSTRGKHLNPTPVHGGMVTRSRQGTVHTGGDDLSRFTADPANPLGGAPRGKRLTPVQPVPGQRSRTSASDLATLQDLGRAVLDTAYANSASDDRAAHGYGIGTLPGAVNED